MAYAMLDSLDFGLSTQVLQEFYVNALQKTKPRPTAKQAEEWIDWLSDRPLVPTDLALVKAAILTAERYGIAYWDAAIIVAAERLGASILDAEDPNLGQRHQRCWHTILFAISDRDPSFGDR